MTGPHAGVAAPGGAAALGVAAMGAPPAGPSIGDVDRAGRWLALGLGLLATGIFLLTTRGVQVADNLVHADAALGIATRGSPALSFDPKDEALAWRRPDGRVVSSLGPGLPIVAAPFVALGAAARRLGGAPRRASGRSTRIRASWPSPS